jgi:UDP-glucose 4-epimerase
VSDNLQKVVILGGTGFIGSALMKGFEARNCQTLSYSSSDIDLLSDHCVNQLCEVLDENTVLVAAVRARGADPYKLFLNNVVMATNVARTLEKRTIRKCVYFSSFSVYNDAVSSTPINEDTRIDPTSPYGVSKCASELLLGIAARNNNIALLVLRPCKVYGPGDYSRTYGPMSFTEAIARGGSVQVFGDGTELRDHIYIGDVVDITVAMSLDHHCGTYNLASGEGRTFVEALCILHEISGRDFETVSQDRTKPRVNQQADITRLLKEMPGYSFTSLKEGLRNTYEFVSRERCKEVCHG